MNSGAFESEEELRRWLSRHPAMQWPQDLTFDATRVWEGVSRSPSGRRYPDRRWSFSVLALTAAVALVWLTLGSPRSPHRVRPETPAAVTALRPTRPVLTGALAKTVMTGVNTGWAVTQGNQVLRTVSGGQQWKSVTPPNLAAGSGGGMPLRLTALGSDLAWVALDIPHQAVIIERTVDGGRRWTRSRIAPITFGGGGVRLYFVSRNVGWAEVLTAGNASPSAALYGTVNGGASWRQLTVSTASGPGHIPFGGSLAFSSARDGYLVGAPRAAGQVPWRYYVAQTQDGGSTWTRVVFPEPTSLARISSNAINLLPPIVVGASPVLIPAVYTHSSGAATLVIYAQSAPTGSWTARGMLTVPSFRGTLKGPDVPLVTFATASEGWAVVHGGLYRTVDGGKTWALVKSSPGFTAWMALTFVSAHDGWALTTSGQLWDTVNAGATWTEAAH